MMRNSRNKYGKVRDDRRGSYSYSMYPDLRPNLAIVGESLFYFLGTDPCAFDAPSDNTSDVPERRLCRALLLDAVDTVTVRKKGRDKALARDEAKLWFLGETEARLTFSYCCQVLGLDESYFMRRLREVCDLQPKRRREAA